MNFIKYLQCFSILSLLVSCGAVENKIKDVRVDQTIRGQDSYLHLFAELDLGNIYLPSFRSDIRLAGRGKVGEVELGADSLEVSLNITEVIPQLAVSAELPNGAQLPLIKDNPVVVLPLASSKILVYISLVQGATVMGLVVPIRELDNVGKYSAFFPPFKVKDMSAAAGLYTSEYAGESGLGAFFDVTEVVNNGALDYSTGEPYYYVPMGSSEHNYEIHLETDPLGRKAKKRINSVLKRLHRRKKTVELY